MRFLVYFRCQLAYARSGGSLDVQVDSLCDKVTTTLANERHAWRPDSGVDTNQARLQNDALPIDAQSMLQHPAARDVVII